MTLYEQMVRDEGVRFLPYIDTLGNGTIGIGHRILPTDNFSYAVALTQGQVDAIYSTDMGRVTAQMGEFSWYQLLDDIRQASMANMAFNLGVAGLLHFPSMLHYLSISDWTNASAQALQSQWAVQLKYDPEKPLASRPGRIARQILTGVWT